MEELAHPLTLRFSDRCLEREYRAYRLRAFFRAIDTRYLAAQTLLAACFFLLQPYAFPSIEFHWANIAYPAICLANLVVITTLPWPSYELHRHNIQLLFRALVDWTVVRGLPAWSPPVAVRSLGNFATHLVLTTGAGCLNWGSLGWPLLLQHHLPYNLLAVTIFSHLLAPHVCTVVQQTPRGRALLTTLWTAVSRVGALSSYLRSLLITNTAPTDVADVAAVVGSFDATADADADASGGALPTGPGSSLPASSWLVPSILASLPDEASCWATVSFVQLFLGFVIPTALVYVLERGSREFFLHNVYRPDSGSSSSGGGSSGDGDGAAAATSGDGGAAAAAAAAAATSGPRPGGGIAEEEEGEEQQQRQELEDSVASERPRPSPGTRRQLRFFWHVGGSDGWNIFDLLHRALVAFLALVLVLLLWELQVHLRFMLPLLLRGRALAGNGGSAGGFGSGSGVPGSEADAGGGALGGSYGGGMADKGEL